MLLRWYICRFYPFCHHLETGEVLRQGLEFVAVTAGLAIYDTILTVSGDVNWTLWDKKGKEELGQLTTLASGEYIIKIQQNKDKGSLACSVTLK